MDELGDGLTSVMLINDEGKLRTAAGPNLPEEFNEAIDDRPVFGLKDIRRSPRPEDEIIVIEDVRKPAYTAFYGPTVEAGFVGTWVLPIFGVDTGRVLGILCGYYRTKRQPSTDERTAAGALARVAAIAIERDDAEAQLSRHALHDWLTGLANRTLLIDRLEHALDRGSESQARVALLLIDIDGFQKVNDTLGHQVGDEVLQAIAARLVEITAHGDTVARLGGDQFVILREQASEQEALALAQLALTAVATPPVREGLGLTASVGAIISGGQLTADAMLRDAAVAQRRAQERGRARVEAFDVAMGARALVRQDVEAGLRRAVEEGAFELLYQPEIHLASGRLVGVEALLRWDHPLRGLVAPASFLAVAEECGLIVPIGRWVIEEAARQAARWQAEWPAVDFTLWANLSARQLADGALAERTLAALSAAGAQPSRFGLEVTETVLMADLRESSKVLGLLREAGVRVAVDDFGTGYSSLAYTRRLPIDTLKLDRMFVAGLARHPGDAAIVAAVATMAHGLDVDLVAEGVETASQVEALCRLGYEVGQGYYFARPTQVAGLRPFFAASAQVTTTPR